MHSPLSLALTLARASNLPTVWSNVLAGWLLTGQPHHAGLWLALAGGTLAYAGGCTLNDAFDAKWDRQHRPERPIPSGAISERAVWRLGGSELLLGSALLGLAGCAWPLVAALAATILFYDWCHKRTAWAVAPMGLCRVLLGWCAASMALRHGGSVGPVAGLWLAGLFAYVMGLTLVARREAKGGGVSWPGVALALAPLAASAAANRLAGADLRDWLFVAFLFGLGARHVWLTLREKEDPARIGKAVSALLAGIVAVDFLFIAQLHWHYWGLLWLALLAASVVWQKRVAAT